jgi:hypothetical protein
MAFTPDLPFPKSAGDSIKSKDWNDLVTETRRLDTAKVERAGDAITGSLSVAGALAVGKAIAAATAKLDVAGSLSINDNTLYLRGGTDTNHGLAWYGGSKAFAGTAPDGPVLWGNAGGALGTSTGGAQKVALAWNSNGDLRWGNNSCLAVDQGGSIELGGDSSTAGTGTPFIDFHFQGKKEDFNARIINDADGQLNLVSKTLRAQGNAAVVGTLTARNFFAGAPFRTGAGKTVAGSTAWQVYSANGIFVDVNTTAAQFATTPIYVTALHGLSMHWATTGATSVYLPTATGFRIYVKWSDSSALTPQTANTNQWHIQWIGVEI